MLSLKETAALLEILSEQRAGVALESKSASFQRAFVRAEHFRVAACL